MNVEFHLTTAPGAAQPPDTDVLRAAAEAALRHTGPDAAAAQLSVRIVDEAESAALNERYRGRCGATNVLSFPAGVDLPGLWVAGDLAICAAVVEREAHAQGKTPPAHWAHMVVHGILHLHGFDHIEDDDARTMEAMERRILAQLGHADPYASAY